MTTRKRFSGDNDMTVLAGDIGGTNSRLAIFERRADGIEKIGQQTYPSRDYGSVAEITVEFLESRAIHCDVVCLGLPGPVGSERVVQLTNLPWRVDRDRLRRSLNARHVELINDVEASAIGVHRGPVEDFVCLREGRAEQDGNRAIISLGTGLGVAGLTPSGRAFSTEAGHATFSPRTEFDLNLHRDLSREFDHVSWERVASGPALTRIYDALAPEGQDRLAAPAIVDGSELDPTSRRTLEIFGSYVGAVTGNIALTMMATGGIFFCGGVAPKVFDVLGPDPILAALVDKGRMRPLLERIPIYLVRDDDLAVTGAAHLALGRDAGA
jgi:glucokinase